MEENAPSEAVKSAAIPVQSSNHPVRKPSLFLILLGVFLLLLIASAGSYYLGILMSKSNQVNNLSQQPTPVITQSIASPTIAESTSMQNPENTTCHKEECLFNVNGSYLGFAILKGYYKKYDATDWGNQKVSCDSLLTTDGNEKLINEFRKSSESGNALNKIIEGQLLINIDLSDLSATDKSLIEQSSLEKQVEIGVIRRFEGGMGVSTCYSLVDIISVKPLTN